VKDSNHAYARSHDVRSKLLRLMNARTQKKASVDSLHQWTVEYFKEVAELDVVRYTIEQITSQHKDGSFADNFRACSQKVLRVQGSALQRTDLVALPHTGRRARH